MLGLFNLNSPFGMNKTFARSQSLSVTMPEPGVAELERDLQGANQYGNDMATDRDQWRSKASELEATNASPQAADWTDSVRPQLPCVSSLAIVATG